MSLTLEESPKEIWLRVLGEPKGLGVSNTDAEALRQCLEEFRMDHPEWVELKEFYFLVRSPSVLEIRRIHRNTPPARSDGDYRPI